MVRAAIGVRAFERIPGNRLEYFPPRSVSLTAMTKSTIVLIVVLIAMAGAYVYWFTDWFQPATIQILAQVRPARSTQPGVPGLTATYPVSFAFDRKARLTELKVVSVDDEATNKFSHAVWHLISDSNSVPTKALIYGQQIRGMKPKVPQARPEPLQPEVKYRLYVAAGKYKGQIDFKTIEVPGGDR
jgi:hypothetical protein